MCYSSSTWSSRSNDQNSPSPKLLVARRAQADSPSSHELLTTSYPVRTKRVYGHLGAEGVIYRWARDKQPEAAPRGRSRRYDSSR